MFKTWARVLSALSIGLLTCLAMLFGAGSASANPAGDPPGMRVAFVVFGGVNDPVGDLCGNALVATRNIPAGARIEYPTYPAQIGPWQPIGSPVSMIESGEAGIPNGVAKYDLLRAQGYFVNISGCSEGSDPAIGTANAIMNRDGIFHGVVNTHGGPQGQMGIFHSFLMKDGNFKWLWQGLAGLPTERLPQPGIETHAWGSEGDVWFSFVPNQFDLIQDINKLNATLTMDVHAPHNPALTKCSFVDKFGITNHVFDDGNPYTTNNCDGRFDRRG